MASTGLLVLLDDITSLLDDIAMMTKITAKKTAGLVGDDLAVNAEKVTGVRAQRELPVVWAVAKGSLLNKAILVPTALLLSVFLPWLVTVLLIAGGCYLCYEGFEKTVHGLFRRNDAVSHINLVTPDIDLVAQEKTKIKGAIRTDFILSAEIIVIALGVVQHMNLPVKIAVLSTIAVAMTVGVYGLVALLLKLDDIALHLMSAGEDKKIRFSVGSLLLRVVPHLMALLSLFGTVAMFMVGGGIMMHNIHYLGDTLTRVMLPLFVNETAVEFLASLLVGLVVGAITLLLVSAIARLLPARAQSK